MNLPGRPPAPIIQLDTFEGPLDLLLSLVERRRLPVVELSLAAVADQYLAQVRALPTIDPDALSEFLAIAARLLLLKSRSLLPAIEPPAPPDAGAEEDGAELVRRLETYRTFKLLAEQLGALDAEGPRSFSGGARPADSVTPSAALQAIAPELLASLYLAVERRRAPAPEQVEQTTPRVSVAQRLHDLRQRLTTVDHVSWQAVCGTTVDEIVATLLAVLELVRRGELTIVQPHLFGPIRLQSTRQCPVPTGDEAGVGEAQLAEQ